jgi:type I restriction-modification system DNA methylase subunit
VPDRQNLISMSERNGRGVNRDAIRCCEGFIWSLADLLRGDYKQSDYQKVILPLVVVRRLDCVLEPTKATVVRRAAALAGRIENLAPILQAEAGQQFYNTSPLDFWPISLRMRPRRLERGRSDRWIESITLCRRARGQLNDA